MPSKCKEDSKDSPWLFGRSKLKQLSMMNRFKSEARRVCWYNVSYFFSCYFCYGKSLEKNLECGNLRGFKIVRYCKKKKKNLHELYQLKELDLVAEILNLWLDLLWLEQNKDIFILFLYFILVVIKYVPWNTGYCKFVIESIAKISWFFYMYEIVSTI